MSNQIKSRKRTTSQKEEKATTGMLWLLWKVYHNWLVCHKIRMNSFLKVESLGETRCRKSWNPFNEYDSLSLRYVKQVSRKKKRPSLGKIDVKVPYQRSPYAMKFESGSHEETSDVPEARLGILQNIYTSSTKKTRLHSTFLRRNGYSRLRQQKSRRKESL